MEAIETLDVTTLVHSFKNMIILNRLDHLSEGKSLILQNHSDPLPLYYSLLVERGTVFNWEYIKKGPDVWEVKITKLKNDEASLSIGEIVARDYRKVKVLQGFGITVLNGREKILEKVCQEKNLDITAVEQALKEVEKEPIPPAINYNKWNLDFLMDYIVHVHHRYVAEIDPEIHEYLQKVAEVNAAKHFEIIDVTRGFIKISSELKQHLRKEQTILFPYIKKMVEAKRNNLGLPQSSFGSISKLLEILEREHNNMIYEMKEIEFSSTNFTVPEDTDTTFHTAYTKLKMYLEELQLYIHIENNILFPKAIEMEKELMGRVGEFQ